jgi:SmpA / OmlA family
MTRRRLLLFALPVTLVLLGSAAWALWPHSTAITWENAKKIKEGMTMADVEAILGGPTRDETAGCAVPDMWAEDADPPGMFIRSAYLPKSIFWTSEQRAIEVIFKDDRVWRCYSYPAVRVRDTFLDRARRWIGW